jgi:hypothetical protein
MVFSWTQEALACAGRRCAARRARQGAPVPPGRAAAACGFAVGPTGPPAFLFGAAPKERRIPRSAPGSGALPARDQLQRRASLELVFL